ncbi:MAG TPA: biotin/lipoate--protein ligase family protein [Xanthobacteraceae bacterium]|nr:biotin/lipoate--protein ligase family protein [Xanthobacteraceae bacterium]
MRPGNSVLSALVLPPPYRLVSLREVGDAFLHAQKVAAEEGAGTLVYVGRFDMAEFAVVLEPDEPLRSARRAFYAGMNAMTDALLAHAPPEKPIVIDWPDALRVDGGLVGGGRLAWPQGADEDAVPDWLVFGGMIRTVSMTEEAGLHPLETALDQEGFEEHGASALVESFARHLMVAIDVWEQDGFGAVVKEYLPRLSPEKGARRDIDENGDLLVRWIASDQAERRALVPALAAPSWYDARRGGPRR